MKSKISASLLNERHKVYYSKYKYHFLLIIRNIRIVCNFVYAVSRLTVLYM